MKINRYKKTSETTFALGATLVFELIKASPALLVRVFLHPSLDKTSQKIQDILSFCEKNDIDIIEGEKAFNVLSPKDNTFMIAEFKKSTAVLDKNGDHIVLVNPSDAGNIGTIIRSAVGFGFKDIAVINPAVDAFSPKAVRASMGAIFHINIQYFRNIEEYMNFFKGHHRYAFMLRGAADFSKTDMVAPFALIFGNEAAGLPAEYVDFCTPVKIPQSENIDSLSLPMAATIAMYINRK